MYSYYSFEYGYFEICYEKDIVLSLRKKDEMCFDDVKNSFTDEVFGELLEYLQGKRKSFDFKYELRGTEFQLKVWNALLDIPYGDCRTYKDIAVAIGNHKAARAVGMANNKNPILIAVPCHRVIGANGKLVGYGAGIELKKYLLDLEKSFL